MRAGLILAVCLLAGSPGWADSLLCFSCHGRFSGKLRDSGRPLVDEGAYAGSVHGGEDCVGCHRDKARVPHPPSVGPVDCASRCHGKENEREQKAREYADSVHGKGLQRGESDVPTCKNCHGEHYVLPHSDATSMTHRRNLPRLCGGCHDDKAVVAKYHLGVDKPYLEYYNSVHGRALYASGLEGFAAVCTDCHGVHTIRAGESLRDPATCGRCHEGVYEEYLESVHGKARRAGDQDSPGCVDCHGEHGILGPWEEGSPVGLANVVRTCSHCHEVKDLMARHGVPTDRVSTYKESFHGVCRGLGGEKEANCASCHGHHNIKPSTDPSSPTHLSNLPRTCGKCHPRAGQNFARGAMHVDPRNRSSGPVYYVRAGLRWTLLGVGIAVGAMIGLDLLRRVASRKKDDWLRF